MPGKETSTFGQNLLSTIKKSGLPLHVFYDHGDADKSNVGKIYSHTGSHPSRSTNLAEVDVMVANDQDEVELLIEIEEIASLGPKKILGVLMAILLSESISFNKKKYKITPNTVLICSGRSNSRGYNTKKILNVIKPRVKQLCESSEAIVISEIIYVLEETLGEVVAETERRTQAILSERFSK